MCTPVTISLPSHKENDFDGKNESAIFTPGAEIECDQELALQNEQWVILTLIEDLV